MATTDTLERFVLVGDGSLRFGRTLPGRGAWLCAGSISCLDLAVKRRSISRSLRAPVDSTAVERLRSELDGSVNEVR